MTLDLLKVKERLEKEGIVNEVKYYENEKELTVNEEYFIYDQETGECDLYYIKIAIDNSNKYYIVSTHFAEGDFLHKYNNQEDYIRKVITEMNEELGYYNNLTLNKVFNTKMLGESMIKHILNKYGTDGDSMLFWVNEEFLRLKCDIYKLYDELSVCKVFENAFYKNREATLDYAKSLIGLENTYDNCDDEFMLDAVVCQTIESVKSCYWNNYSCKFMPRDMMKETLYELASVPEFSNIKVKKDKNNGEYISIPLCENLEAMITTEEHGYSDVYYTLILMNKENLCEGVETIYELDKLIEYLIHNYINIF